MGERNEDISKDYKILQKVRCKGSKPALLTIRVSDKDHEKLKEVEKRQAGEGQLPKLYSDIMSQQEEYKKQKQDDSLKPDLPSSQEPQSIEDAGTAKDDDKDKLEPE